ncbi:unnamed protein product [Paramecium octaurelia]|uniref:Tetratricopeptide repeat protein n=1 Tax=Paramecium octaurelia TaxID=43137 RepID=A0A8S1X0G0_PAROT|nr:unnamed protein product [Paramecium octaurelia]
MQSNNTQYSQKEHKHCLKEQKVEELYQATLIKLKEQSTQDGLQIINDFLQLFPSNGKALTIRGELFLKQNLNDYALNDLNQAIELGSFNEVTLYNRATVFQRKKMFKESQEDCEKAIQINPNYGLAYMRIGTIMLAKGQFHEALKYYNKAIEVDERCYFAYIANLMNKIQQGISFYQYFRGKDLNKAAFIQFFHETSLVLMVILVQVSIKQKKN